MTQAENLRAERESRTVAYTLFLEEYNKHKPICYGFVEGKDDPSYYQCHIDNYLPSGYKIRLFPTGRKECVKQTYDLFDWRSFDKKRIVFFMDRDLSDIIEDPYIVNDSNVYITDQYSIENDIISSDTLEAVLKQLLGFAETPQKEIDTVIRLFDVARDEFDRIMLPVMGNIIYWKTRGLLTANYRNIKINHIISIQDGRLTISKNEEEIVRLIYRQSGLELAFYSKEDVEAICGEIVATKCIRSITRGKYLATFFIEFCNSVYRDCVRIAITKTHKGCTISEMDIMKMIAPRCRIGNSLRTFINDTILAYIAVA